MHIGNTADPFEVVVVGIGIVGIAHALAAARSGARVALIDTSARAVGASIRNFGFVTVTGQERHEMWHLARRSRDVWAMVAPRAGIDIVQTGLAMVARRPEAVAVLEAFLATEMGAECRLVDGASFAAADRLAFPPSAAALLSPHELRVEARDALPRLLAWLIDRWGVTLLPPSHVRNIGRGEIATADGTIRAERIFVCPGDNLSSLYPDLAREMRVSRCKLQMLRLADPGYRLPAPIMSDLGLARYEGYAALPQATALRDRLEREQGAQLAAGVHLIVTQSTDGSLVVGDSHGYGDVVDPFQHAGIDGLILDEFRQVLGEPPPVIERWIGTYAWSPDRNWFSREVEPGVHVTVVTCGAGMSTAFAIGEDVVRAACGAPLKDVA